MWKEIFAIWYFMLNSLLSGRGTFVIVHESTHEGQQTIKRQLCPTRLRVPLTGSVVTCAIHPRCLPRATCHLGVKAA
ncbi:hypothetical protein E2C01_100752 [Portunus trituberculatus]|uniref:Secreted protein n=1 Tax=Portunus trituberculatus TaxID=210409 RepID=A0A5B7K3Y3_PORTR|nr:hypothetical protein [Portunus trituberculatus]